MENIWLLNNSDKKLEICIVELKKYFEFHPGKPVSLPRRLALKYQGNYNSLNICDNPQDYFKNRPLSQLIIRDAGIGDLLLLEPVLRALKSTGNMEIDVLTRYPSVFDNNPVINKAVLQNQKDNTQAISMSDYDAFEDLRSYSETSPNRAKEHRTDIYNEKFNLTIDDKEPRLYIGKNEKSSLKKKAGFKYVGIQLDASHSFRRFFKKTELIKFLAKKGLKVVVLGSDQFVKDIPKDKNIIDLQGKTSIREVINIINDLDYMIAVDSGLMHVALSLHIPTIAIFSIITPDLRMRYYTGQYKIITKQGLDCIGCGDLHMDKCRKGDNVESAPPCMDLDIKEIYEEIKNFIPKKKRFLPVEDIKNVNINLLSNKTLTMPIIVQNEEKNLPRFIENVINHPSIGRVIAIDGGSTDKTIELLRKAGAEVYGHPYIKTYHEMQAMQRNISCSYVKDGENIFIMDLDECFSQELSDYLPVLASCSESYGIVPRRTFNYYKDIDDISKAIKDYPDYQPRFYKWDRKFKFVGGAHHITLNCPEPFKISGDIIHFELEGKDRKKLEKQWSTMMEGVKKYV